jgi:hypothetical protein
MQVITALAILALAQCGPGGCQAPQSQLYAQPAPLYTQPQWQFVLPQETPLRTPQVIIQQTPMPAYEQAPRKQTPPAPTPQAPPVSAGPLPVPPERDYGYHLVEYEGMIFPVWGYHTSPKKVRWNPADLVNKDQIARARSLFHPEQRPLPGTKRFFVGR